MCANERLLPTKPLARPLVALLAKKPLNNQTTKQPNHPAVSPRILTYIAIMIVVTNLIRIIPMVLIRGRIRNTFLRSFLYYVPYVTLAVMTFPAIIQATQSPIAGGLALLLGIIAAMYGLGLFPVAVICCIVVFVTEMVC